MDDDEIRVRQLRLQHAQEQWEARWALDKAPPRNNPDLRPIVHECDRTLRRAAQILSFGSTIVSPQSVQALKNALFAYEADGQLERGEISEREYTEFIEWLEGPGTAEWPDR